MPDQTMTPHTRSRMTLDSIMPGADRRRLTPALAGPVREAIAHSTIAVIGATGAVGLEALALLVELGLEPDRVIAVASDASVGREIVAGGRSHRVRGLDAARSADVAVVATPAEIARSIVPHLLDHGVLVSDNTSAFRHMAPLVLPELGIEAVSTTDRLASSPNCTTTIALTGLGPLLKTHDIRSLEIVSYQAVSGAGIHAMQALLDESADLLGGAAARPRWLDHPAAFNAFPHESPVESDAGTCAEERKFARETTRLLATPPQSLAATCLRVPVLRSHTVAARLHVAETVSAKEVRDRLRDGAGVRVVDDGPTSHDATGGCEVLVGRLRTTDAPDEAGTIIRAVIAGDQLLKGAAWNAIQNAALLRRLHDRDA